MNITEGARRMRSGGIVLFLLSIGTAYLGLWAVPVLHYANCVELLFAIMIPGALLWLAGWILQGFAKPNH
jgi:hypothetical protein